jgi:hypothetical protein
MCRGEEPCTQISSCLNCTELRICRETTDGNWVEVYRTECDHSACDPYLAECRSSSEAACPTYPEGVSCLQDGLYPAENTASGYIVCENNVFVRAVECRNFYYDPANENCSATVPKFYYPNVIMSTTEWYPFRYYPRIYGFYDRLNLKIVAKCDYGYTFSYNMQKCLPDD